MAWPCLQSPHSPPTPQQLQLSHAVQARMEGSPSLDMSLWGSGQVQPSSSKREGEVRGFCSLHLLQPCGLTCMPRCSLRSSHPQLQSRISWRELCLEDPHHTRLGPLQPFSMYSFAGAAHRKGVLTAPPSLGAEGISAPTKNALLSSPGHDILPGCVPGSAKTWPC